MNLETLQLFCDLVEMKNFSRTGQLHGISQSAVSQQVAQIELEHKIQLFDRKKRPIELTGPGEIFYRASKDILDRYNQLQSDLSLLSRSICRIRMASIFSIGMHTLQPYIKKFIKAFPDVNLAVEYLDAKDIYDLLLRGSIDIGVVAIPKRNRNLQVFPFENEPLLLVCSPEHPLSKQERMDVHLLQGEKFIAFAKDIPTRVHLDSLLKEYNVSVQTIMEFDNTETIKRAIEINAGIGILPKASVQTEVTAGTLVAIPFSNEHFYRPTGIVVRKDHQLNKAAQYLVDLMRKEFDTSL
ncbi:MAG: LysR family transcriptional regulator [Planctomycetaceae bacterium]|nr:LysR family transcriptional regulator [Planctomycetaceae bacterium]